MKRSIFILLACLFLASPALGVTNFYVDCSDNESTGGAGTSAADAFDSIGSVKAYEAATGFADGDDIYLLQGSTCVTADTLQIKWEGVDADNYSILGCYEGQGDFDCSGARPIIQKSGGSFIVNWYNPTSYFRVEHVEIQNTSATWNETSDNHCLSTPAAFNNNEGYITVTDSKFYHCSFNAINLAQVGAGIIVTDNVFDASGNGVYLVAEGYDGADHGYIARNTCTDLTGRYNVAGNVDGHCVGLQTTDYYIVEDNVSTNAYNTTYIVWVDSAYSSIHNVFRNNTSNGNRQIGISIFHDTTVGDANSFGNLAYQNTLKSDADEDNIRPSAWINSMKSVNGNYFFNNTIYDAGYWGLENRRGVDYSYWLNNIVVVDGVTLGENQLFYAECNGSQGTNHTIQNNLFWTVPNTDPTSLALWVKPDICGAAVNFATWEASDALISGNIVDNPDFVDTTDFELDTGSPAIDAGVGLTTITSASNTDQTSFNVANTYILHDDMGLVDEDGSAISGMLISLYDGTYGIQNAEITGITYGGAVVVTPAVSWVLNETTINLRMFGNARDAGANESGEASSPTSAVSQDGITTSGALLN